MYTYIFTIEVKRAQDFYPLLALRIHIRLNNSDDKKNIKTAGRADVYII